MNSALAPRRVANEVLGSLAGFYFIKLILEVEQFRI